MSHVLPPLGHPAREMFEVADLVAIAMGDRLPIDLAQAKRLARRAFAANKAIRRLYYIIMRADDAVQLLSVGHRGGHKVEWYFGHGLKGNGKP